MLRNKLVRSDGSIIDSSVIISCEFTEEVNSNTNLSVGDVTASELTVEFLSSDPIQQDEVLTYSIIEDGVETKIGVFKAEKPTQATRTTMRFSAYDNIIKTEKPFSDWLMSNQGLFPMSLRVLVENVCSYCGVELATTDFPHADMLVGAFYADDITCRQVLSWVAAIAGRFVKANADGELEFAWFSQITANTITPAKSDSSVTFDVTDDGAGNVYIQSPGLSLSDDGAGNVSLQSNSVTLLDDGAGNVYIEGTVASVPFLRDTLSYESYTTELIDRVQINHSEDDVGVIYPEDAKGNCFTISGNMILGAVSREDVTQVARSIYEQLNALTYVPFSVTVPRTIAVRAGERIVVQTSDGNTFGTYVMKMSVAPSGTTLSATGDKSYGSNAAVSSEKYGNLTGKVLRLSKSVDGLVVRNEDLEGRVGGLELTTGSFKTYVEETFVSEDSFTQYKTESKQTAEGFSKKFESFDQYRNETSAHINSGLLDYTDDNVPVYGVEIGQRTERDGEKVFDKYARFTSDKLSFYDQGGNEVTQIGDKKMGVTNVEITGSHDGGSEEHGTFKHGGFVDIAQADGSIVSKWVGGSR